MAFPVDILTNVDHEFLELAAEEYMSQILYRNPDTAEYFRLPDSKQVRCEVLSIMSACFPLYKSFILLLNIFLHFLFFSWWQ